MAPRFPSPPQGNESGRDGTALPFSAARERIRPRWQRASLLRRKGTNQAAMEPRFPSPAARERIRPRWHRASLLRRKGTNQAAMAPRFPSPAARERIRPRWHRASLLRRKGTNRAAMAPRFPSPARSAGEGAEGGRGRFWPNRKSSRGHRSYVIRQKPQGFRAYTAKLFRTAMGFRRDDGLFSPAWPRCRARVSRVRPTKRFASRCR
jgi:hypothetical protein